MQYILRYLVHVRAILAQACRAKHCLVIFSTLPPKNKTKKTKIERKCKSSYGLFSPRVRGRPFPPRPLLPGTLSPLSLTSALSPRLSSFVCKQWRLRRTGLAWSRPEGSPSWELLARPSVGCRHMKHEAVILIRVLANDICCCASHMQWDLVPHYLCTVIDSHMVYAKWNGFCPRWARSWFLVEQYTRMQWDSPASNKHIDFIAHDICKIKCGVPDTRWYFAVHYRQWYLFPH